MGRFVWFGAAILLALCCGVVPLSAAEYYVAPTGSDTNPGTLALPFASIARGQTAASAGDTVWLRGGTYQYTGTTGSANAVLFNKSGTSANPIKYWAYPGETPAFDFFNYLPQERIRGFSVRADWLHFRGIELRGVQQTITNVNESWGIRVENGADNNIFERLNLHHNEGPGLFIQDGGNNLVLNSDSHHNYDPDRGGENADGFGSHSNDNGNMFIGNRAWENSDDGFDFINSRGNVVVMDSWSWRNGYVPGTQSGAGNGAGFKAGGFGLDSNTFPAPENVPRNLVEGNVAFNNRTQGFYANHHPGGLDFISNTAYANPRGFDLLADVDAANVAGRPLPPQQQRLRQQHQSCQRHARRHRQPVQFLELARRQRLGQRFLEPLQRRRRRSAARGRQPAGARLLASQSNRQPGQHRPEPGRVVRRQCTGPGCI